MKIFIHKHAKYVCAGCNGSVETAARLLHVFLFAYSLLMINECVAQWRASSCWLFSVCVWPTAEIYTHPLLNARRNIMMCCRLLFVPPSDGAVFWHWTRCDVTSCAGVCLWLWLVDGVAHRSVLVVICGLLRVTAGLLCGFIRTIALSRLCVSARVRWMNAAEVLITAVVRKICENNMTQRCEWRHYISQQWISHSNSFFHHTTKGF